MSTRRPRSACTPAPSSGMKKAPPRGDRSGAESAQHAGGATTLSRLARVRTSTLDRDLNLRPLAGTGEPEKPRTWTAEWVRHRLVEAFTIERQHSRQAGRPRHRQRRVGDHRHHRQLQPTVSIRANWRARTCGKHGRGPAARCPTRSAGWRRRCPGPARCSATATPPRARCCWPGRSASAYGRAAEPDDAPARLVAHHVLPGGG